MSTKSKSFKSVIRLNEKAAAAYLEIIEKPLSKPQKKSIEASKGLFDYYRKKWESQAKTQPKKNLK